MDKRQLQVVGIDRESGETITTPITGAQFDAIWLACEHLPDPFIDEDDDEHDV